MAFKVFSTFTGIGGFELGIHHAACNVLGEGIKHIDIVGYSEIDKPAISVYEYHFKGAINYGDITEINTDELPEFDCLVGGFPCQAFSIAGKRKGFDDTRGTLFFDLARILRAKQPRLFVFENVKGLLNHDSGRTFKTIIATITELGYDCQWQVLNSKNFGVPQNRERIIIVGHLRGTPRPQVFPITSSNIQDIKQINKPKHSNDRIYSPEGLSPTLNTMQGGMRQPKIKVREATIKGYAEATIGDAINLSQPNSKTRRGRIGRGIANTLDTGMHQYTIQPKILDDTQGFDGVREFDISPTLRSQRSGLKLQDGLTIRRLTPLECERLQAFPDNWTKYGMTVGGTDPALDGYEVSDTQRYKMCGNAVTTNVIEAVFERIFINNG